MKTVMIIAAPRTGTNYLLNLLYLQPRLHVFHEVFHPDEAYGFDNACVEIFGRLTGAVTASSPRHDLKQALQAYPEAAVDTMAQIAADAGADHCFFKCFATHLNSDAVRRLITHVDTVLFVKRPVLETFVSLSKADAVKAFHNVDTTDVRPALDPVYFRRWFGWTSAWYVDTALAWISQKRSSELPIIRYAEFSAGDDRANLCALVRLLNQRCGLQIPVHEIGEVNTILKQDRNTDLASKVQNLDAFVAAITDPIMRRALYGYF